ncbi:MAG TPA: ATP-binding protein, partial [Candidatus Binatia bacterium]|nr:ATP-binding protein [Candidatus Binatia bacterium]
CRAVHGPGGEVIEFQAIGRDVTDRKRAERANELLAHASRLAMVGELTASIAHEINQPLGAILNNAEAAGMLLDANPENLQEVKQILSDIRKDDVRASEVVLHIRTLLRKRQLEMQLLQINQVAEAVLRLIHPEARQREMEIQLDFAQQLPLVKADRVHVQQLFLNLILNGMDAMAETPKGQRRLKISTLPHSSGGVQVNVRDAGRGIPAERFPRLFESFYSTKPEGMGLGLSISRDIIEAHRGRIWAENNPEGGATFCFMLPPTGQRVGSS